MAKTDTAYYHRDLQYNVLVLSNWTDPAESDSNIRWTRDCFEAVESHLAAGVYVNDLGEEGEDRVMNAYGGNYERLVSLKKKCDPTNLFRHNQNIKPTI